MRTVVIEKESGRKVLRTKSRRWHWIAFVLSLVIVIVGSLEISWVLYRVINWNKCDAFVVSVLAASPGALSREYSPGTMLASPQTTYTYIVECSLAGDSKKRFELNVSNRGSPTFVVGEFVSVVHDTEPSRPAIVLRDMRTWSVGFFVLMIGLIYLFISSVILVRSRRSFEVPEGETI